MAFQGPEQVELPLLFRVLGLLPTVRQNVARGQIIAMEEISVPRAKWEIDQLSKVRINAATRFANHGLKKVTGPSSRVSFQ